MVSHLYIDKHQCTLEIVGYPATISERIQRTGRTAQVFKSLRSAVTSFVRPAKPALKNAAAIPLTIAGLGCVTAGVFLINPIAGLMVLGPVLVLIEHMIAED